MDAIDERFVLSTARSFDGQRQVTALSLPDKRIQVTVRDAFGMFKREFRDAVSALAYFDAQIGVRTWKA